MSAREHTELLLEMARKDLKALAGMLDSDQFSQEVFGFHAQQAVEKAAKAWLNNQGVVYRRVHDLRELLAEFPSHGHDLPKEFSSLWELTDYALQIRYVGVEGLGHDIDRESVLELVRRFVEHVEKSIG